MVIFESFASGLLTGHLFIAILTLVALAIGIRQIFKKDWDFGNKMVLAGSGGYILTWILGILIYPVFRVSVRAANFDTNIPWATGLFEIKEHVGSIGLLAAIVLFFLAWKKGGKLTPEMKKLYAILLVVTFIVTVMKAVVGIVLTGLDSI